MSVCEKCQADDHGNHRPSLGGICIGCVCNVSVEPRLQNDPSHDFADDCPLPDERCPYCGCCVHGKTPRAGCKVEDTWIGMHCPDHDCSCEGQL